MSQIPETPNTNNELTWTIEQVVGYLPLPVLDRATLSKLGREASLAARAMRRPTTVVQVTGKPWPTEKAYTRDVLAEVFRLNPVTAGAYAKHVAQQGAQA